MEQSLPHEHQDAAVARIVDHGMTEIGKSLGITAGVKIVFALGGVVEAGLRGVVRLSGTDRRRGISTVAVAIAAVAISISTIPAVPAIAAVPAVSTIPAIATVSAETIAESIP